MTNAQKLAKEMMEKKGNIDWEAIRFKMVNDKDIYLRFVHDADPENILFYVSYKQYKLNDSTYVNYPTGFNNVQKTLNGMWATGDSIARSVYSTIKGHQNYNAAVVLCDATGKPIESKAKIWTITSKKLWERIIALYFEDDFLDNPTIYFKVNRTGEKLSTEYTVTKLKGERINPKGFELVKLDLPLAFAKSDAKAQPVLDKLNHQFNLGVSYAAPSRTTPLAEVSDDEMDQFEKTLMDSIKDE